VTATRPAATSTIEQTLAATVERITSEVVHSFDGAPDARLREVMAALVTHLHLIVRAPGYRSLTTHVFDSESEHLASDAVFAVKPSLVRTFVPRDASDPDRPAGIDGPWTSVENDLVLAPEGA